jgi:ankyrin repeat protein
MDEMIRSVKQGDAARVRALLEDDPSRARARDENGVSALLVARYYGQLEAVGLLREASPDLDVFEAAALGDTAALAELLDAEPDLVNAWSPDGFSPLQLASFFGHAEAVALLLQRGAETGAVSRNELRVAALHSACASPENGADPATVRRIVRLLLDNGADAAAKQERGFTPLHAAAHHGVLELVELLLERGADPAAATDAGETPAAAAAAAGHREVAARLE